MYLVFIKKYIKMCKNLGNGWHRGNRQKSLKTPYFQGLSRCVLAFVISRSRVQVASPAPPPRLYGGCFSVKAFGYKNKMLDEQVVERLGSRRKFEHRFRKANFRFFCVKMLVNTYSIHGLLP